VQAYIQRRHLPAEAEGQAMKRVYLLAVLAIVVAAALGIAVAKHSGYVLISYGGFRYQSGLWAALAGAAGMVALLWLLRYLVGLVLTSSGVVNPWSRRNRSRRIRVAIEQGQLDLAEGRWAALSVTCTAPPRPSANRCCITSVPRVLPTSRPHRRQRQPAGACLGAPAASGTGHCPDPCPVADGPW
jgi:hypothetical protein